MVVDTLRADAIERARTPVLDRLSRRGDAVARAWSPGTWTVPSTISLFSGLPIRSHGWNQAFPQDGAGSQALPDAPDVPMLAEVLQQAGVSTHARYANPLVGRLGLDRGFQDSRRVADRAMAAAIGKTSLEWDPAADHFLYVHLLGPHQPLTPGKASAKRWDVYRKSGKKRSIAGAKSRGVKAMERYRRAYHAVVEDTDRRIGRTLRALGPWRRDAVIIVTSDHGELLGEDQRMGHPRFVNEPLTHVPLIATGLGDLPDAMCTTGLAARITDAFGVAHAWPEVGTRSLPLVSQREDKLALSPDGRIKGVWDPRDLPDHGGFVAFDLQTDPTEQRPDAALQAELEAARLAWQAATPQGAAATATAPLSDEMAEMLSELGYLGE